MHTARLEHSTARKPLRFADWLMVAGGSVILVVTLAVLFTVVPSLRPGFLYKPQPDLLALAAQAKAASEAHRVASILFTDQNQCEELLFDNYNGAVAFKGEFDCDARFEAQAKADDAMRAERMRGVVKGFIR